MTSNELTWKLLLAASIFGLLLAVGASPTSLALEANANILGWSSILHKTFIW